MRYYLRSELAKIADINSETLRFYEKSKLIPTPKRSENGYRQYPENILIRLELIKQAKKAGFTLNQIKELFVMAESENISITDITNAVDRKINEIDIKLKKLKELKKELQAFNKEIQTEVCPYIESLLNNSNDK